MCRGTKQKPKIKALLKFCSLHLFSWFELRPAAWYLYPPPPPKKKEKCETPTWTTETVRNLSAHNSVLPWQQPNTLPFLLLSSFLVVAYLFALPWGNPGGWLAVWSARKPAMSRRPCTGHHRKSDHTTVDKETEQEGKTWSSISVLAKRLGEVLLEESRCGPTRYLT